MNKEALAGAADVDVHFKPKYKPWDQRMALVPDSDLFNSVRSGKASIETDDIDCFTESGLTLKSGKKVDADIIVPATGLDLQLWGKMNLTVDGHDIESTKLTNYKGMMFSQIPNFVWVFGYTNSSWTLKAELTYDYVCRLLEHMEQNGYESVYPYREPNAKQQQLLDLQSGYILRAKDKLPKQGESFPWCNKDLYFKDVFAIKHSKLDDGVLRFDDNAPLAEFHQVNASEKTDNATTRQPSNISDAKTRKTSTKKAKPQSNEPLVQEKTA